MKKKTILRRILLIISWLCVLYNTIIILISNATVFNTVCVFLCYFIWTLCFILSLIEKIKFKITIHNAYEQYENGFAYLKAIHKARYKLYFSETSSEDIETFSKEIESFGNSMLKIGEDYISSNKFTKKQTQQIKEIISETKKLMTTVR